MIITVSGLLGAGKSTLTKNLADSCKCKLFEEPVETNPFLDDYYKDPARYAFEMQVFLMFERSKQAKEAYYRSLRGETVILDSNIWSDMAFAIVQKRDGYFTRAEFDLYHNLYRDITLNIPRADYFVWLEMKPQDALERIKLRSRDCECNIPLNYLEHLYAAYQEVLASLERQTNILRIDAKLSPDKVLNSVLEAIDLKIDNR